jgi:DNA-binding transcriptional LysR family regulator
VREPEVAELRAFCAAATLGSIASAARSLNVSQPALSKRLRALETVTGEALFERTTRGVTLTVAGAQLYAAARRLLDDADMLKALIRKPAAAIPVQLACSTTIAEHRLPAVLAELAQLEPGLSMELVSANSARVRELVRFGRVDLGITAIDPDRPPEDGLAERVIWRDEVVIGVPHGHPWEAFDEIPLAEFARTPTVQRDPMSNSSRVVAVALERAGVHRVLPSASIGSTRAIVATADATNTPALLSLLSAREHADSFVIRRVESMRFDREFALVWAGGVADLPPTVQAVAQHLLDLPFARSRRTSRQFQDD